MSISIHAPAPFVVASSKKGAGGAKAPKAPKLKGAGPTAISEMIDMIGELKERMAGRLALA